MAELVGPDPTFKLQRDFLPEMSENHYELFDGFYQIHGTHPGITPFTKEYCRVENGEMTRYLSFRKMLAWIPQMQALEPVRYEQVKSQIVRIFDEMADELDHPWVRESIMYQKEDIDLAENSQELRRALNQLIRQRPSIIKQYKEKLEIVRQIPEDYL